MFRGPVQNLCHLRDQRRPKTEFPRSTQSTCSRNLETITNFSHRATRASKSIDCTSTTIGAKKRTTVFARKDFPIGRIVFNYTWAKSFDSLIHLETHFPGASLSFVSEPFLGLEEKEHQVELKVPFSGRFTIISGLNLRFGGRRDSISSLCDLLNTYHPACLFRFIISSDEPLARASDTAAFRTVPARNSQA